MIAVYIIIFLAIGFLVYFLQDFLEACIYAIKQSAIDKKANKKFDESIDLFEILFANSKYIVTINTYKKYRTSDDFFTLKKLYFTDMISAKKAARKLSKKRRVKETLLYVDIDFKNDDFNSNENILVFIFRKGYIYSDFRCDVISHFYPEENKQDNSDVHSKNENNEESKNNEIQSAVTDTSIGLDAEALEKINKEKTIKYTKLIEKYQGFLDKGLISEEEFELRKDLYLSYIKNNNFVPNKRK